MDDTAEKQQRKVGCAMYVTVSKDKTTGHTRYAVDFEKAKRFFSDATLPDELKWKLGMLYAQNNVPGAGTRCADKKDGSHWFFVTGSKELRTILTHDPRSESQSEGEADTG